MPLRSLGNLISSGTATTHERLATEDEDSPVEEVEVSNASPSSSSSAVSASSTRRSSHSGRASQLHHPLVHVETVQEEEDNNNAAGDVEEGLAATRSNASANTNHHNEEVIELFPSTPSGPRGSSNNRTTSSTRRSSRLRSSTTTTSASNNSTTNNNSITLAELEEEREMARRRVSFCVLLAVFVLFRLWLEALSTGDFFLMMLCLFGTSWTARFIRHNREHEEALDERIRQYLQEQQNQNPNADPDAEPSIDRDDLRTLSFQAQLALALMESQRQMQMGGYGNPDGYNGDDGVSETAKGQWEGFTWKEGMEESGAIKRSSLTNQDAANSNHHPLYADEAPHCSICLGDYEEGEHLIKLPCSHIYHKDCIASWTDNHTRCPLCNLDLESVVSDNTDNDTIATNDASANHIV